MNDIKFKFFKAIFLNFLYFCPMGKLFAENLKVELIYNGYKIKEFAEIIGVPYTTMLSYLGCKNKIPRVDVAVKIAKVLHTSVEYLITGKEIDRTKIVRHYPTTKEFLYLEPEEQKALSELIHHLAEKKIKETKDEKY